MASAADMICEALETEIVTGVLPLGTRLEEPAIAERFGVSRTPVREALHRLSASGLIELRARRGTRVVNPPLPRMVEMFEVMAELEAMCGRLCARRADAAVLAELNATLAACAQAADHDPSAYYAANRDFHEAIYRGSGNGFLAEEALALHHRLTPYRRLQLRTPRRIGQSLAEHRTIAAAISDGDEDAAAEALRAHIVVQGERFSDFVSVMGGGAAAT